ncbi:Uncharacterised protein [Mycobacteroides abscessus subsp. abscessus]|nr:Uncharacterised protein [Mycobacteroides abscessus subsp. abscessus]SIM05543.1 Uncharacterised protein [Mycobacteroides abscessus subsp. abscessus]SLI24442.1 Uncharacterised protein [Mycobacteroides abscessus subsp. abscessus]
MTQRFTDAIQLAVLVFAAGSTGLVWLSVTDYGKRHIGRWLAADGTNSCHGTDDSGQGVSGP